ncbi:MAG: type II toxin-antitoxin system VapC family toxin [Alphaproteobacteria bacterium]|nr:type II toxin-antitoxin system VapC family toxin [Alphaproteobacteria bacterium]
MILDSSAVLAMLFGEPEAAAFAEAAEEATERAISAASWLEAAIVADNRSAVAAAEFTGLMARLDLEIVPFTASQAVRAREAHRHYGKGRHKAGLNLGDCFSYALAKERGQALLFKGDDFAATDIEPAIKTHD